MPLLLSAPAAGLSWEGCALRLQTVHQARFEHAHGGAGAKRLDDRVLPDAKAHLSRSAPGRASTSGQDRQHDLVRHPAPIATQYDLHLQGQELA